MTRRTMNSTRRGLGLAAAALCSTVVLTGCGQTSNDYTTDLQYDAADGVSTKLGDLHAVDVLIVNDGKSETGKLSGMVANAGDNDQTLTISLNGQQKQVKIPAGSTVRLDGKPNGNDPATIAPVDISSLGKAKPGEQIMVKFNGNGSSSDVAVPILLNQPPYGDNKLKDDHDQEPKNGVHGDEKGTSVTANL